MFIKPRTPWYYLTWAPPRLIAEDEIALASLVRRRGLLFMVGLFWGIVTNEGRYTTGCFSFFLAQNYPFLLCSAGYLLGVDDCGRIGLVWLATFVFGTVRHMGWLVWLLFRWPPLAKG